MTTTNRHQIRRRLPRLRSLAATSLAAILLVQSGCQSKTASQPPPSRSIPATHGGGYPDRSRSGQPKPSYASFPLNPVSGYKPRTSAPYVSAKAAIVVQANSGNVLFARNADTRLPVASTQKLLLGLMMVEAGRLDKSITIQPADTWCEPTKMYLKAGQVYRKGDLLKAVLVRSSNDIARALARDHSGSVSGFARAMDVRARRLGMNNSHFTNASGLPDPPGQYSTARDLSILAAACMRHDFIRDAVRTKAMTFRYSNGSTKALTNTNKVLRTFPYCTGMKTGYTNAAGRCLVSSGEYKGRRVIVVMLGSKTPNIWTESQALLQWGLGM